MEFVFDCPRSKILYTVMVLSFRADKSLQTLQTQIRLLLESSLIRVYTVCNSLCIFWMHFSMVKPPCSKFRVLQQIFWVSEFLGVLRYCIFYWVKQFLNKNIQTCTNKIKNLFKNYLPLGDCTIEHWCGTFCYHYINPSKS